MVLGNPLTAGGGDSSTIAGVAWNLFHGTGTITMAGSSGNINFKFSEADGDTLSLSNGVFTCLKAGDYKVSWFGRGGHAASSPYNAISVTWRVYVAGSSVANGTYTNWGGASSETRTLSPGDTVYATGSLSTSTTSYRGEFGFVIEKVA